MPRIGHALGDLLQLVLVLDPACTCVERTGPQPVTLEPFTESAEVLVSPP